MTMPNPDPALDANPAVSRIGRFYVTRELGRGSIGTVYLAHDPIIDRPVAIKTFNARSSALEQRQHEQQFINEARTTGRLSHPNIVTVYDASIEGGTTYIAMEYLQGRELSKMLDKGHQFTPDEVASVTWKVADALDHAHQNGVIHRDVKPANIFMTGNNQPKVVDFGIARSPNRLADGPMQNSQPYTLFHHNLLGTPNYMSPEQAMGRAVDLRTDVYSLGAVMYEMLTGRKPFQSSDRDQLLQAIAHKAPNAPHEVDADIPVALSRIVMKAMSKRPDKRFQTAEEMGLEIKRYLTHERRVRRRVQRLGSEEMPSAPAAPSFARSRLFWMAGGTIAIGIGAAYLAWMR